MTEDRFRSLLDTARVVNSSDDLAGTLEHVVVALCRNSMWSTSTIMIVDQVEHVTKRVARFDPTGQENPELPQHWALDLSPARVVIETGGPIIVPDARHASDFPGYQADAKVRGYRTVVVLPLNIRDERGLPMVAAVQSKTVVKVAQSELSYLEAICELAAIAIRKLHVIRQERETASRLELSARHSADLVELVLSNARISKVLELAESLIGPQVSLVVLCDDVVYAGRSPACVSVDQVAWQKAVAASIKKDAVVGRFLEEGGNPRAVTLNLLRGTEPLGGAVEPLMLDGRVVGALFVLGSPDTGPVTRLLLNQTRFALSVAILREHVRKQSLNETRADILLALLASEPRDRAALTERAVRYGLHPGAPHRLFAVSSSGPQKTESVAEVAADIHIPASTGIVARAGRINWVLAPGDGPASAMARRLEQLFSARWGLAPIIGASDILASVEEYPKAASRLRRVLDIALRFGRTGLVPERLSSSHLSLLAGLDPTDAREFVKRHLGGIREDDSAMSTVRAYLAHSGRLQAAADDLSIHVSTLRYRIEKVQDRFKIDFGSAEARFNLELAIVIADLLHGAYE